MNKRILVVEDDDSLRYLFRTVLTFAECDVLEADNTVDARTHVEENYFDFIISDVELEGETTLGFIQDCCNLNLTVVVVSSNEEYLTHCREMGVLAFIRKPIAPSQLIKIVQDINNVNLPHSYIATRKSSPPKSTNSSI